jgi:hypothetical protein
MSEVSVISVSDRSCSIVAISSSIIFSDPTVFRSGSLAWMDSGARNAPFYAGLQDGQIAVPQSSTTEI